MCLNNPTNGWVGHCPFLSLQKVSVVDVSIFFCSSTSSFVVRSTFSLENYHKSEWLRALETWSGLSFEDIHKCQNQGWRPNWPLLTILILLILAFLTCHQFSKVVKIWKCSFDGMLSKQFWLNIQKFYSNR